MLVAHYEKKGKFLGDRVLIRCRGADSCYVKIDYHVSVCVTSSSCVLRQFPKAYQPQNNGGQQAKSGDSGSSNSFTATYNTPLLEGILQAPLVPPIDNP